MMPLGDVRIISLEQYGAGPYGSLHLADLGAEIIKVEDPGSGGDVGRHVPPYANDGDSLFFQTFNRNKRSIALDLRSEPGRRVFEDLVRHADAVYSNLRGDVPSSLGITYQQLAPINPAIVCCSLSGYGMTGPRSGEPAYDYLLQGTAGWMSLTGEPDGPPTKTGLSVVDFSGGLVAAAALISGIHAARRDGVGMDCDVSLYDTALSMLSYLATWQLNEDYVPTRHAHSAHPSLVPFQAFPTQDRWIVIACAKEKFWQRLVAALERPELGEDPRFTSFADRFTHRDVLIPELERTLRTRTTADWLAALSAAGVPSAPVNSIEEALRDPQVTARRAIVEVDHPRRGRVRQIASPVRVGPSRTEHRPAPEQNADFDYITREILGYDEATIAALNPTK